ncbi:MerR family transcriptional regulator [Plantactinospora sp. S1510]|uniref:MerR family transcriptional regulator n=1 Tax=Plantactinospora alkalitolerans TaxID=2789879 RepID=A0ABS0H6R0_9ACTN|nr:MerR family transcriptional regulator [Plantactinospora alkalitolerans]MBF9134151.1 MerR family transcriptional regulator [Plantactinospora alkalitolerans]
MQPKYLRSGEFGAAGHLSPKALRLYAEQGLLRPASVDPATGYRYYSPDQLPRARLIARLRRIGLPLARIGQLADLGPEARAIELRGWLHSQRALLEERAALVETMRWYGEEAALVDAVALREVPATKVLCRSRHVDTAGLDGLIQTAGHDIRGHLRTSGLADGGATLVHFQDLVTPDSEGLVEVAVQYDGNVDPTDDLYIRLVPAHTEAYLPVPAGYEDFPLVLRVYDAVEAWTDARPGVTCVDHPYEIHPGTDALFDVAYPVST